MQKLCRTDSMDIGQQYREGKDALQC